MEASHLGASLAVGIVKLTDDVERAIRFPEEANPAPSALERGLPEAEVQPDSY